jgi:hypothetical protein
MVYKSLDHICRAPGAKESEVVMMVRKFQAPGETIFNTAHRDGGPNFLFPIFK